MPDEAVGQPGKMSSGQHEEERCGGNADGSEVTRLLAGEILKTLVLGTLCSLSDQRRGRKEGEDQMHFPEASGPAS